MAKRQAGAWRVLPWILLLLITAGGGFWAWQALQPEAPASAKARGVISATVAGDAKVLRAGSSLAPVQGSGLFAGDVVDTGEHLTDVTLPGATVLRLGPLTRLELTRESPSWRVVRGALRVETGVQSPSLTVELPFGLTRVPAATVAVLDMSVDAGVFVRAGTAEVVVAGHKQWVTAARHVTMDGSVAPCVPGDPLTLEELVYHTRSTASAPPGAPGTGRTLPLVLVSEPGTRVARNGIKAGLLDKRNQKLLPGDTVVTTRPGNRLLVDTWGELVLDANTTVSVVQARQGTDRAETRLQLAAGGMRFTLASDANQARVLGVQVGAHTADIVPGRTTAAGYAGHERQQPTFTLRMGRMRVGSYDVEAGSIVNIDGHGPDAAVHVLPLAEEAVEIGGASKDTVVHHIGPLPALKFVWAAKMDQAPQLLEVARDANFREVRWAEQLRHGQVIVDTLKTGRKYFWRLDKGPASALRLVPQTPFGCATCSGPNPVNDDLVHTVIQFEETMPELAFGWRPFPDVATYLFRIYHDKRLDAPAFVLRTDNPGAVVPADKLLPGGYVWRVAGFDDEGRLVRTGPSYELDVQDVSSHFLTVVFPAPGATVNGPELTTRGVVAGTMGITCNGHGMPLGQDNSFAFALPLHAGENLLTYALKDRSGVRHAFTRTVYKGSGASFDAFKVSED